MNREISKVKSYAGVSVFGYFKSELTRGYLLERDQEKFSERRQRVYTFMKTPREVEKFLLYGYFHCMDTFLFIFTFLPLRIVVALLKILTHPCGLLTSRTRHILEPAQACDILKGIILVVCCIIVNYIDTSMMYHLVRGQAVIKLYVFYNMLDMADRLFSSFGQDILEALFWTATEPKDKKREHVGLIPHLMLAIIYVVIHTLLILFQATVLNVAFNSHNKALLTIMMSNNFVEIKGNMFKKIDKNFLYHIACSDVKERFNYVILLTVVFIRNMTEFSWDPAHIWVIIPDAALVLIAELFVDWIKHAFIVKFNEIPADVYHSFSVRLSEDLIANRQNRAFIDYSDLLARRMGFTPLPLACLLVRICTRSFKITGVLGVCIIVVLYFCLMTFKVLISIIVLGKAYNLISDKKPEDNQGPMKNTTQPENADQTEIFGDSSQILIQSSFVDNLGPELDKPVDDKILNSEENLKTDMTSDLFIDSKDKGDMTADLFIDGKDKGDMTADLFIDRKDREDQTLYTTNEDLLSSEKKDGVFSEKCKEEISPEKDNLLFSEIDKNLVDSQSDMDYKIVDKNSEICEENSHSLIDITESESHNLEKESNILTEDELRQRKPHLNKDDINPNPV